MCEYLKCFLLNVQSALELGIIIKVGSLQLCEIDRLHPKEIDYLCKLKIFNETQVWKILVNCCVFKFFYISIKLLELCEFRIENFSKLLNPFVFCFLNCKMSIL